MNERQDNYRLHNVHDKFFRQSFEKREVLIEFFEAFAKIDFRQDKLKAG